MSAQYDWSVGYPATGVRRNGTAKTLDDAKKASEDQVLKHGSRGVVATIHGPKGGTFYLCPKERGSGLKWDRRP